MNLVFVILHVLGATVWTGGPSRLFSAASRAAALVAGVPTESMGGWLGVAGPGRRMCIVTAAAATGSAAPVPPIIPATFELSSAYSMSLTIAEPLAFDPTSAAL